MKTNQTNEMKTFRELWKEAGHDELERYPEIFIVTYLNIPDWDEFKINYLRDIDGRMILPDVPRQWNNGEIICYYHSGINENGFEVEYFEFYEIKENKLKFSLDVYETQLLFEYEKAKLNEIIEKINKGE